MFAQTGLTGDFLKLKETRALFRQEQHFPSSVIDRGLPDMNGSMSGHFRARARSASKNCSPLTNAILCEPDREREMLAFAKREGQKMGMQGMPGILHSDYVVAREVLGSPSPVEP